MEETDRSVQITGVTGHVGFRILVIALKAGYKVRAAVRSQTKADQVLAAAPIKELNPGYHLPFAFVSDLTAENSFSQVLHGVKHVIHVASATPSLGMEVKEKDYNAHFIKPAINGTIGMLSAAEQAGTVKRIVITSSVVAIAPWKYFTVEESSETWSASSRIASSPGHYANDWEAYAANAIRDFMSERKPVFGVTNIMPSLRFSTRSPKKQQFDVE